MKLDTDAQSHSLAGVEILRVIVFETLHLGANSALRKASCIILPKKTTQEKKRHAQAWSSFRGGYQKAFLPIR